MHVTKLYELVVQYPSPLWASTPEAATESHYNRQQNGSEFILEQLPGDENPAVWTRLYAIYALYAPKGLFESFKNLSLKKWIEVCGRERLAIQPIVDQAIHWQALVVCEGTPQGPAAIGWGKDVGAITLMDLRRMSDTYVRVHHTWRGRGFDAADSSAWPVTKSRVVEMLERMGRIKLTYNPDANQTPIPNKDFKPGSL